MSQHLKRTCTVVVFYPFKSFVLFCFVLFFLATLSLPSPSPLLKLPVVLQRTANKRTWRAIVFPH